MHVIADGEGNIMGTARIRPGAQRHTLPPFGFIPEPGQELYQVEVPEELARPEAVMDLHCNHRLYVKSGTAMLVRFKMNQAFAVHNRSE